MSEIIIPEGFISIYDNNNNVCCMYVFNTHIIICFEVSLNHHQTIHCLHRSNPLPYTSIALICIMVAFASRSTPTALTRQSNRCNHRLLTHKQQRQIRI